MIANPGSLGGQGFSTQKRLGGRVTKYEGVEKRGGDWWNLGIS